ncbi:unnamed protein product, partial [Ixodes pacificus]
RGRSSCERCQRTASDVWCEASRLRVGAWILPSSRCRDRSPRRRFDGQAQKARIMLCTGRETARRNVSFRSPFLSLLWRGDPSLSPCSWARFFVVFCLASRQGPRVASTARGAMGFRQRRTSMPASRRGTPSRFPNQRRTDPSLAGVRCLKTIGGGSHLTSDSTIRLLLFSGEFSSVHYLRQCFALLPGVQCERARARSLAAFADRRSNETS